MPAYFQAPLAQEIQKLPASAPDIQHGLAVPEEVEVTTLAVADKVLGTAEDVLEGVVGSRALRITVTAAVALDAPCHRLLEDLERGAGYVRESAGLGHQPVCGLYAGNEPAKLLAERTDSGEELVVDLLLLRRERGDKTGYRLPGEAASTRPLSGGSSNCSLTLPVCGAGIVSGPLGQPFLQAVEPLILRPGLLPVVVYGAQHVGAVFRVT